MQAIVGIQRTVREGVAENGYDILPSQDIPDWYDEADSDRFTKRIIRFQGKVFVDATEWGELLALSGVEYLQGVDSTDGALDGDDKIGQATVFGFVQQLHDQATTDQAAPADAPNLGFGSYADRKNAWNQIWTYRRILGHGKGPAVGDLSLQNWGYSEKHQSGGNDYPFGYLFLTKKETAVSRTNWRGGVDLQVMAAAEQRALAWHHWFKQHAASGISASHIAIAPHVLGTGHGLSKLPYIRDTRRSIGIEKFVLKISDLMGDDGAVLGREFPDTVALGAYPADVHPLVGCSYPAHVKIHYDTRPFHIPFRALTHYQLGNLLVAGKTMAQSFMANSATRLHPIEWSTGTAAGIAAAWMSQKGLSATSVPQDMAAFQQRISRQTPIRWTTDE